MHKDKLSINLESLGRRAAEMGGAVTELLSSLLRPGSQETSLNINMLGCISYILLSRLTC